MAVQTDFAAAEASATPISGAQLNASLVQKDSASLALLMGDGTAISGVAGGIASLDANAEVVQLPAGAAAAVAGTFLRQDGAWVPVAAGEVTAWVNFDGTTGTIRSSFNIASVTRNSTGDYTIAFAAPMANANYAHAVCVGTTGTAAFNVLAPYNFTPTVDYTKVFTFNSAWSATADCDVIGLAIFGGK